MIEHYLQANDIEVPELGEDTLQSCAHAVSMVEDHDPSGSIGIQHSRDVGSSGFKRMATTWNPTRICRHGLAGVTVMRTCVEGVHNRDAGLRENRDGHGLRSTSFRNGQKGAVTAGGGPTS